MAGIKGSIGKGVKKFSKWATSEPHQTGIKAMGSAYNEPLPDYLRKAKPTLAGAAKMAPAGVTDIHRAGLGYVKKVAQAIGKGAGRLAYGKIADRPASVKPNVKRKK
jgi:hypothetical protein